MTFPYTHMEQSWISLQLLREVQLNPSLQSNVMHAEGHEIILQIVDSLDSR